MKIEYRTIWISDVHLGTRGCKAEYLLDFLKHVHCDRIYLVGDIIDIWKLKGGFFWPRMHNEIIQYLISMAARGVEVIYIPGNHDELFRGYIGTVFNGIQVIERAVHEAADGKKYLVLHGDEFDGVVCTNKWLAVLGSGAYDFLIEVNRWFNQGRRLLGFPYWSMSAYIKHKVKNAVNFIYGFEETLLKEARERGLDGVICGHIHHAIVRTDEHGITYGNSGDWVESCTALTEDAYGALSVVHWVDDSARLLENMAAGVQNPVFAEESA